MDRPRALGNRGFYHTWQEAAGGCEQGRDEIGVCALKGRLGFWVQNSREQGQEGEMGGISRSAVTAPWALNGVARCGMKAEDILEVKAARGKMLMARIVA